jgi:hypothetical protein
MSTDAEYAHRGYPVEGTRYGKGSADAVIRAAAALLKEVR